MSEAYAGCGGSKSKTATVYKPTLIQKPTCRIPTPHLLPSWPFQKQMRKIHLLNVKQFQSAVCLIINFSERGWAIWNSSSTWHLYWHFIRCYYVLYFLYFYFLQRLVLRSSVHVELKYSHQKLFNLIKTRGSRSWWSDQIRADEFSVLSIDKLDISTAHSSLQVFPFQDKVLTWS